MKIVSVDLETTGLDPLKNEIIEIGFVIFDDKDFKIYAQFNLKVKPEHIETAHPKALEVNGYKEEDWKDAISLHQALTFFAKATDKATLIAHNVAFDWAFLEASFNRLEIKHTLNYHKLDTLSMAWIKIPNGKIYSYSLKTICTYLKIPPEDKIHRAVNGAIKCYEVYKELIKM
jgi:DNA polymerase III epsilon subunit-like protein